jgi:hypothetical protein
MGLQLNAAEARKADNFSSVINETGKYVGVITRAEKLLSRNRVEGIGLSFKTDDGASANYLDVYTVKENGEKLRGHDLVQALLCCLRLKTVDEGQITFEKWDNNQRKMVQATANGYPVLMGKRIGMVLQKQLETHSETGADTEKMQIVVVFEAATGLSATEILDSKTKAERIDSIVRILKPVRDSRKAGSRPQASTQAPASGNHDFDDDIPF